MCKIDLRLFILISCMSVKLYAADGVIQGLETAAKIAQAAKPVVDAAVPLIKEGAEAVGEGVEKVAHHHKSSKKPKLEDVAATVQAQGKALEELRGIMEKSAEQQEAFVKKQIASVKAPTLKNPRGFVTDEKLNTAIKGVVKDDPNDPLVTESKFKAVTAPLQLDVQRLQAGLGSCVTQQQLSDATVGTMRDNPENPYVQRKEIKDLVAGEMQGVVKEDKNNPVLRQNQINDVVRQNDLQGYITKNDLRNGVKYAAGQFALGFSSYRLSWMIESLLQSAGMENQYVDLKDLSVPITTCMASFAARSGKEIYQHQNISDLQTIVKKSLTDAASSAIVIALKNIFCDTEMRSYFDENYSENQKAGMYGIALVPVSLIVDSVVHQ